MRLGLYGGTFDPIHLGHLILAEACREACGLDRVWFVVAGAPPHKPGGRTDVGHRLEMARLAVAGNPAFEVSEIETKRPGPHYSVETLEAVARERPGDELFFLIGADSLVDLPHWREPGKHHDLGRPGRRQSAGLRAAADRHPRPLRGRHPAGDDPAHRDRLPRTAPRSCREGRSIRYQVPRAVEAYMDAHGLYRPGRRDVG